MPSEALWAQLRRLLLGTVVEALLAADAAVAFSSLRIDFDDDSTFRVPRLNNYMRFKGAVQADLRSPLTQPQLDTLQVALRQAWPELLAVVDIPFGDRLTDERNTIAVTVSADGEQLRVDFDLAAD